MMEQVNRLIAHKLWLNSLNENNFVSVTGEFESSYILLDDERITRVSIIASVVNKFKSEDGNYISATIDDSSAQIRLKAWRKDAKILDNIKLGDMILVIGKMRKYNDELYILPEIIRKVSLNEELLRKLELIKKYGIPREIEIIEEPEPKIEYEEMNFSSNELRNNILNLIEKHEENLGITSEEIKNNLHSNSDETNKVLEELIKEGQIYQIGIKYRLTM